MNAAAERGKGKKRKIPSVKDLYNRDGGDKKAPKTEEELRKQYERTAEWLERIDLSVLTNEGEEE